VTLLTVQETADHLSCSPAAVRKWMAQGRLGSVKVGRLRRIRAADVERIAAEGLPERP
jgi:excisionase family DNA binding protein